ncbi:MAG: site-specific integrase [Chloroflexi bacterium]|nr:site-specific integrase [Chloroflexota bacterium]MBU1751861.1 site-specific integrase [Chloroflexota bacterium]
MQLEQAIERYLDYAQYQIHLSPATVQKYRQHLDCFQRFMTEQYPGAPMRDPSLTLTEPLRLPQLPLVSDGDPRAKLCRRKCIPSYATRTAGSSGDDPIQYAIRHSTRI